MICTVISILHQVPACVYSSVSAIKVYICLGAGTALALQLVLIAYRASSLALFCFSNILVIPGSLYFCISFIFLFL